MTEENSPKKKGEVRISASSEKASGEYCNAAAIRHSRSEFILDFVFRFGNEGHLVSRVVTNPQHAKALLVALQDNIDKYEKKFGPLAAEAQPQTLH